MKKTAAFVLVAALYLLHQDLWLWREAEPLVLGILPAGLFYHATYTVATAAAMWVLVHLVWPSHLEDPSPLQPAQGRPGKSREATGSGSPRASSRGEGAGE